METFLEMINKLIAFLYEASLNCNEEDVQGIEQDSFDIDYDSIEESLRWNGFVKYFDFVYEKILEMAENDPEEFSHFVSLMALHYATLILNEEELEMVSDDEKAAYAKGRELIDAMLSQDKDDFIESIANGENDYLDEMLNLMFDEDFEWFDEEDLEKPLKEYEYWWHFQRAITEKNEAAELYRKYHPNIKKETDCFLAYMKKEETFDKLAEAKIHSVAEFIQLISIAKIKYPEDMNYLTWLIRKITQKLISDNRELFEEIVWLMVRYYYAYMLHYQKDTEEYIMSDIDKIIKDPCALTAWQAGLDIFTTFDLTMYHTMLESLSNKQKVIIDVALSRVKPNN